MLIAMASNINYRFRSEVAWKGVKFSGQCLSVKEIKEQILKEPSTCYLVLCNAYTKRIYTDSGELVPWNTSIIVQRLPLEKRNRRRRKRKIEHTALPENFLHQPATEEARLESVVKQNDLLWWNRATQ